MSRDFHKRFQGRKQNMPKQGIQRLILSKSIPIQKFVTSNINLNNHNKGLRIKQ